MRTIKEKQSSIITTATGCNSCPAKSFSYDLTTTAMLGATFGIPPNPEALPSISSNPQPILPTPLPPTKPPPQFPQSSQPSSPNPPTPPGTPLPPPQPLVPLPP